MAGATVWLGLVVGRTDLAGFGPVCRGTGARRASRKLEVVFCLEAPREELKKRLLLRGRADDNEAAIEKRLAAGNDLVYNVIEILAAHGATIVKIDGSGTEEEVFDQLATYVREHGLV